MPKIVDVIKYEGDNSTFVWKHPCEDFNTNTQLIVHESQEAIFFMNGLALDLFGSGRYTLETQNIPLVRNFINLPTDGVSAFHCEVYFVNKTEQMALRWGTDSNTPDSFCRRFTRQNFSLILQGGSFLLWDRNCKPFTKP